MLDTNLERLRGPIRLDEEDSRLLNALRLRAQSHFERIANEYLALLGDRYDKCVVLSDVRARLELRRALVGWIERLCGGPDGRTLDASALTPSVALGVMLLAQEELGQIADDTLGERSAGARTALGRALAIEATLIFETFERYGATAPENRGAEGLEPPTSQLRSAASALVHDVRNPLNGAMLHATFLERELLDMGAATDVLEAVEAIKSEVRRVAELLDDFVDSPIAGSAPRARVPLSTLCGRAVELIARDAAAAGIEVGADISAEFAASDVMLEVDLSRMLDVLAHLLQQALEAALAGGGKVLLQARRELESAVIEVKHTKRALATPLPMLRTLLPDQQQTDEDVRLSTGTLNVALKVVADHGGTIEVDSEPGRTQFRIKLPIRALQQRAVGQHQ